MSKSFLAIGLIASFCTVGAAGVGAQLRQISKVNLSSDAREFGPGAARRELGREDVNQRPLLEPMGTVALGAVDRFVAKAHFQEGIFKGIVEGVKFFYLEGSFYEYFLRKVERNVEAATIRSYRLNRGSLNPPIITALGEQHETKLAHLFALLKKQGNGESGFLLVNDYTNIFYIRDDRGILRTVYAGWTDAGWFVGASPVDRGVEGVDEWRAGSRVFGR